MAAPRLILLAGPNGAGKSTLAVRLRDGAFAGVPFLNADDIARSLAPEGPDAAAFEAGRELLRQRDSAIAARSDLMVETTLATRIHLRAIHSARNSGYTTRLLFVWIASVEVCLERIAMRVMQGGHHIPADIVIRRFALGRQYLPAYLDAVDEADIFDGTVTPRLVAMKRLGRIAVRDRQTWLAISAARQS